MGAAAEQRWRSAEERLYPIAMTDPAGYRRVLEVVQSLVAGLRESARTVDDLVAAEAEPPALPTVPGVPGDLLVQAACGIRAREIAAEREAERRAAVVASARAGGSAWAVLEEDAGGGSVAVHLASGRVLHAVVDLWSGGYRLQETGPGGESLRERAFADAADWAAERERWRAEIESPM